MINQRTIFPVITLITLQTCTIHAEVPPPPAPDAAVAPAPIPDQSQMPGALPGAIPAAGPAAPAAEIPSTQLKWPETVEVTEDKPALLQIANPQIASIFKQAEKLREQMSDDLAKMLTLRADLYNSFYDLDATLDEFLQTASFSEGQLDASETSDEALTLPKGSKLPVKAHSQDIEKVIQSLQAMTTAKEGLKKQLIGIDESIKQGKVLINEVMQKNLTILKQPTEEAAKAIVAQVTQSSESLKNTSTNAQANIATQFKTAVDQLQANIKQVQELIKNLQAKGFALKVAQAQQQHQEQVQEAQTKAQRASAFSSWLIPIQQDGKPGEQATFVHYFFKRMADLITGGINVLYKTYQQVKSKISGKPAPEMQKSASEQTEQKKQAATAAEPQEIPMMPTSTPQPAPIQPTTSPTPAQPTTIPAANP